VTPPARPRLPWSFGITILAGAVIVAIIILAAASSSSQPVNQSQIPLPASLPVNPTANSYKPKPPAISHIDPQDTDPHICEKPDDAYFAHRGPAVPHPAGYQDYSNPKFLFDLNHSDNTVNWANGFKGVVPVCFIVDEKGTPDDVRFPQSPGEELEKHIKSEILSMRYSPGMLGGSPIRVQMAFNLDFK
jgi:hypothetical protein